jgi:hypothetical protein
MSVVGVLAVPSALLATDGARFAIPILSDAMFS